MQRIETNLSGVCLLEPRVFSDARGFFMETYHEGKLRDLGIDRHFVQDNHSKSVRGTLRGLHYQIRHAQAKLCRVVQGEVLDIAVDIRHGSPQFGQWTGVVLSADNKLQIFIPAGFAHGFLVLSETAEFLYKCDDFYSPRDERGIAWDDPAIGIDWRLETLGADLILSDKDRHNPLLAQVTREDLPGF